MNRDGFRIEGIDHVELFVPDRYEAADWYARTLGLEVLPDYEHWAEDPQGPLMISSDIDGMGTTKLALFTGEPRGSRPTAGYHLVAFRVDGRSFLRFLDRLSDFPVFDEDGRRVEAGHARDHGKAFSVYFCDPYGHHCEVTTYDLDPVAARLRRPADGRVVD